MMQPTNCHNHKLGYQPLVAVSEAVSPCWFRCWKPHQVAVDDLRSELSRRGVGGKTWHGAGDQDILKDWNMFFILNAFQSIFKPYQNLSS